ncbi:hypothetical protein ACH42_15195 [Endozoicomonas sp. (ex Bugula neritina AB1)]|nr:hypothetical protein ACH42_15195 [Endozoicomonas sp. (ex Bugula neritina AB1)]
MEFKNLALATFVAAALAGCGGDSSSESKLSEKTPELLTFSPKIAYRKEGQDYRYSKRSIAIH